MSDETVCVVALKDGHEYVLVEDEWVWLATAYQRQTAEAAQARLVGGGTVVLRIEDIAHMSRQTPEYRQTVQSLWAEPDEEWRG